MTDEELRTLGEIDVATMQEDKICIERNRTTGEIAWRFACQQMSPGDLMLWALFYKMMVESGYRGRIEALEREISNLKSQISKGNG